LIVTLFKAYTNQPIIDHRYRIIDLKGDKIPCSFLNTIFINPEKYDWDTYNQILLHEKVHIRQLHSLDILLAELTIIFQWFNPFAWLLRKEIENNLEYLTDEEVLNDNVEPSSYQMSLLKLSAPHLSLRITTNYNQSLLKKRIIMMNAKRSNIHTLWKYFMLLPLFGILACALNQAAISKPLHAKANISSNTHRPQAPSLTDTSYTGLDAKVEGQWYATLKKDSVEMVFRSVTDTHIWNSGGNFLKTELSSIPFDKMGTFSVTRDAGTMVFNGTFDGDGGVGHFKFIPNKKYIEYVSTIQQGKYDEHNVMDMMTIDVSTDYLRAIVSYGYTDVKAGTFEALKYFRVSKGDLYFWKHSGVKDVNVDELYIAKIYHMDSTFVRSVQNLVSGEITFQQLITLKSKGITPEYIRSIVQAKRANRAAGDTAWIRPDLADVIHSKFEDVDSTYIRSIAATGFNLPEDKLYQFKRAGITPGYINEIKAMGYNPTYEDMLGIKHFNITADFIKSYTDIGYTNISINELIQLKYQSITSEYLKSFENLGYKNLPIRTMMAFKVHEITPDYISGFNKLGFNNISADNILLLKMSDVTPQYIASMQQKGLESKDILKYLNLKNSFKDSN
jgi:hypothetical protein